MNDKEQPIPGKFIIKGGGKYSIFWEPSVPIYPGVYSVKYSTCPGYKELVKAGWQWGFHSEHYLCELDNLFSEEKWFTHNLDLTKKDAIFKVRRGTDGWKLMVVSLQKDTYQENDLFNMLKRNIAATFDVSEQDLISIETDDVTIEDDYDVMELIKDDIITFNISDKATNNNNNDDKDVQIAKLQTELNGVNNKYKQLLAEHEKLKEKVNRAVNELLM